VSAAQFIELSPAEAFAIAGETRPGHRLEPVALAGGTHVLPVAVLDDPAHAARHASLAARPTRPVGAAEWVGEPEDASPPAP